MRSASFRSLIVAIALVGAALSSAATADAAPPRSLSCDRTWQVQTFPHVRHGELDDVSVLSATDAWAVGNRRNEAFAARWNGRTWTQAPIPGLPDRAVLGRVSAVSDTDVWAVGGWGRFGVNPLVVHWDGTSWTRAALPDFGTNFVQLADIASDGTRTWAVGFRQPRGTSRFLPVILGWNGHAWTVFSLPGFHGHFSYLTAVAIGEDGNAWAVGSNQKRRGRGLLEQWTGKSWYNVGTPFRQLSDLNAVDVNGPSNVMVIGTSLHELATRFYSLRGSRRSWALDHVPFGRSYEGAMQGVAWDSESTAWAVGWNQTHRDPASGGGVIERWDGGRWVVVADPAVVPDALLGVSSADGVTFAVGLTADGPLVERYC